MDTAGNSVGRVVVRKNQSILSLAWNCERFSMEEQAEGNENNSCRQNGISI